MKILFPLFLLSALNLPAYGKTCLLGVYFGYNDQRPDDKVNDGLQKNMLVQQLTSTCTTESLFCNWTRLSYEDKGNFVRSFQDALGQVTNVELRVRNSSLNVDDNVNRGVLARQQKIQSDEQRREFLNAFKDHDFIFYVGHSRFGYGPDFHPPKLYMGELDRMSYQLRKEESAREVYQAALKGNWRGLDLISCDSQSHFQSLLQSLGPHRVHYVNIPITAAQSHRILLQRLEASLRSCAN